MEAKLRPIAFRIGAEAPNLDMESDGNVINCVYALARVNVLN